MAVFERRTVYVNMFITLEGVACTGKTTLLQRLFRPNCRVHLSDYHEMGIALGLQGGCADALIYTSVRASRFQPTREEPPLVHYFDRSNFASVAYAHIFRPGGFSPELLRADCERLKAAGVMKPWARTLVLLTKPGQEADLVERMARRNNGLDLVTEDYVRRQNEAFRIWAEVFGYRTYTLDTTVSMDLQQDAILAILDEFLE